MLRKGKKTFVIDTKWKRPNKNTASVSDLRQMYTYCRFGDAEKAMLLYPGDSNENEFKTFETDDYSLDQDNTHNEMNHQCKMGFVSVLDANGELDASIGTAILKLMNT